MGLVEMKDVIIACLERYVSVMEGPKIVIHWERHIIISPDVQHPHSCRKPTQCGV